MVLHPLDFKNIWSTWIVFSGLSRAFHVGQCNRAAANIKFLQPTLYLSQAHNGNIRYFLKWHISLVNCFYRSYFVTCTVSISNHSRWQIHKKEKQRKSRAQVEGTKKQFRLLQQLNCYWDGLMGYASTSHSYHCLLEGANFWQTPILFQVG